MSWPKRNPISMVIKRGSAAIDSLIESVETLLGQRGDPLDRVVTQRDLYESGAAGLKDTSGKVRYYNGPSPGSLIPVVGDMQPLGAPEFLNVTSGFAILMLTFGVPKTGLYAYTKIYRADTDLFPDEAGFLAISYSGFYTDEVGAGGVTKYYWIRHVAIDGMQTALNSTNGTPGTTATEPGWLLDVLTDNITESQLYVDLNSRINLIDAADTVAGSMAYRVLAESTARAQALVSEATARAAAIVVEADARIAGDAAEALARGNAITTEVDNRATAITNLNTQIQLDLVAGDNAVVSSLTSAYTAADAATLSSAQSYTYSKAQTDSAISASATTLSAAYTAADAATLSSAQSYTYSRSAIDGADAATLSTLRSEFAAADVTTLSSAQNYTYSQAGINSAIATSADTLRTQYSGGYTGTDLGLLTSGLLYTERVARAAEDSALSQQITMLSAGAGEQFDYSNIWYFDSTVESWSTATAGTTLSVVAGWLRLVSNSGTVNDANFLSPDNLGIDGAKYTQLRLRVRKIGTPTWEGKVYFTTTVDNTWTEGKSAAIAEPSYYTNGISVVTFDMPAGWTGATVRRVRVDASTSVTTTSYYELDWVAVGRPSPGASSAQLTAEQIARADGDSAQTTARETLASQIRGGYAGTDLTALSSGLIYSEREARATAVSGEATTRAALATQMRGSYTGTTLASLTSGLLFDERTARSTADSTEVTARQALSAKLTGSNDPAALTLATLSSGLIFDEKTTRTSQDAAIAGTVTTLSTQVNHGTTGLPAAHSAITTEASTRATNDNAEVTARQALSSKMTGMTDPATATLATLSSGLLFDERTTRTSADSAQVGRLNTLEATVNHGTTGVSATANALDVVELLVNNASTGVTATANKASLMEVRLHDPLMLPGTFVNGLGNWTPNRSGDPATAPTYTAELITNDADFGVCARITNLTSDGHNICTKGVLPCIPGRVYRVTSRFKVETMPTDGSFSMNHVIPHLSETYANATSTFSTETVTISATGIHTIASKISDVAATGVHAWAAGSKYVRFGLRLNSTETGLVLRVQSIIVEDVTDATANATAAGTTATALDTVELLVNSGVNGNVALASSISSISARLNTNGDVANAIVTAQTTATTGVTRADTALTRNVTFSQDTPPVALNTGDLWVDTNDNNRIYRWNGSTWADAHDARITSTASTVTNISTTVGSHTTTIGEHTSSINGIEAQHIVKIDANGIMSGYGLYGGATGSKFIANVDQFAVTTPLSGVAARANSAGYTAGVTVKVGSVVARLLVCKKTGTSGGSVPTLTDSTTIGSLITDGTVVWQVASSVPFVVQTTGATVNGVTVPVGIYMDAAYIVNATINGAQIALLAVDDTHIANLSVDKLTAGSINVGDYIQSSNYSAGSAGWRIHGDGSLEANTGTFRGALAAATGTFAGSLSAATGSFSGQVTVGAGSSVDYSYVSGATKPANNADVTNTALQAGTTITGGGVTLSAGGNIKGGQTDYNTGTGFFLGYSSSLYRFSIGNPAGNRLTWDGTNLTISGALSAATGTFSGTLTADAINAVNTINIAGNAVTVQSSAYTSGGVSSGTGTDTVVQTLSVTASAGSIILQATGAFVNAATFSELTIKIKRDGTNIYSSTSAYQLGGLFSVSASDSPGAGSHTYTVTVNALSASFYGAVTVSSRSLIALEAKR